MTRQGRTGRWMARIGALLIGLLVLGLAGTVAADEPGEWTTVINEDGQAVRVFRYTQDVQWVTAEAEPMAHAPLSAEPAGIDTATVTIIACGTLLLVASGYCFYKAF